MATITEIEQKILDGETVTPQQLELVRAAVSARGGAAVGDNSSSEIAKRKAEINEQSKNPHLSTTQLMGLA